MGSLFVDYALIERIEAQLDLRRPNRDALEDIASTVSQHYDVDQADSYYEGVVDIATGVGKTYVLAGAIDYFAAAYGVRSFAVVAPGNTILNKTVNNFTPGHPKSLVSGLDVDPTIITSENFESPAVAARMENPDEVKVFIFTVQSLLKPTTKQGRRTHDFREGLGGAFYEHLSSREDLVVFADEHHVYSAPKFSEAVRGLNPWALIGLTATPLPEDEHLVIHRYPLAAAIAEGYVKTPVIVGRRDDRTDDETQLRDGLTLLAEKQRALDRYSDERSQDPVNAVMLVIAQSIDQADELGRLISTLVSVDEDPESVLVVHSKTPDDDLATLEAVEEAESPVRVVVAVDKLKEGWDVKNVYVLAAMRALVSEVLTEQTLGRGLRLPYGEVTGRELLDTLEVLAHDRYEELLNNAGALSQGFIDRRTRAVVRERADGTRVVTTETVEVEPQVRAQQPEDDEGSYPERTGTPQVSETRGLFIARMEQRTQQAQQENDQSTQMQRRDGVPNIMIPKLIMKTVEASFQLRDITDLEPFRSLARKMAENPEQEALRRVLLSYELQRGPDGLPMAVPKRQAAVDQIRPQPNLLSFEDAKKQLVETVVHSPVVSPRREELAQAKKIVDAFIDSLGDQATQVMSNYLERCAGGIISIIEEAQAESATQPSFEQVVQVTSFDPERFEKPGPSADLHGDFEPRRAYKGWKRSLFPQAWFDSSTERKAAHAFDDSEEVEVWVRLHRNDLPILWHGFRQGRNYNPDFLVIESGDIWIVEVKADRDVAAEDVQGKRREARRWASYVSADEQVQLDWHYLLVSESDVEAAKGSWGSLKAMGS